MIMVEAVAAVVVVAVMTAPIAVPQWAAKNGAEPPQERLASHASNHPVQPVRREVVAKDCK